MFSLSDSQILRFSDFQMFSFSDFQILFCLRFLYFQICWFQVFISSNFFILRFKTSQVASINLFKDTAPQFSISFLPLMRFGCRTSVYYMAWFTHVPHTHMQAETDARVPATTRACLRSRDLSARIYFSAAPIFAEAMHICPDRWNYACDGVAHRLRSIHFATSICLLTSRKCAPVVPERHYIT